MKFTQPQWNASLAVASGLLWVLAFPKAHGSALSAFALVPLLVVTLREPSGLRRFLWGTLSGCVFFAGACYWIYSVLHGYGGLGVPAAAGVFLLFFLVLALYWGVFAWLAGYFWAFSWGPLLLPLLWVALEWARAHLFSGFPWLLFGYALTDFFPLTHLARWTGVYGLSYLLAALNVAWVWLWVRRSRLATVHLAVLLVGCGLLWLTAPQENYSTPYKAYLVQTHIPQDVAFERWNLETQAALLGRLERLTLEAVGRQDPPALVIWPEMPAPFYFWEDSFTQSYAESIARRTNSYFLMGIVAFVPGSEGTKPLNSEVLLAPNGQFLSQYDKIHLVPFGEYVPLKRWLGFAGKLTAEAGDFVPGNRFVVNDLPGGRMSGLICYEAVFPDLVRRFVAEGAELLVNISNDGWFGSSAARQQHLLMARMRAIETARFLLRATNTGITAIVRPDGKIAAAIAPDQPGVLEGRWGFQTRQTFYTRQGDWFPAGACLALAAAGILAFRQKGAREPGAKRRGWL
ncbi:MAG: apolipoprotein N-acyltransferase [Acidobacteria bacterium]|nr:apolipoprotein N-acyltransferase [Acidobacteriota bacterium]